MRRPERLAVAIVWVGASAVAQTSWTGAVSTNWSTSGNWSAGVPTSTVDATIPSAPANQPSSYSANPVCRDLTILPGATLTLGGSFDLTVAGSLDLGGSLSVTSSSSTITVTGNWSNTGSFATGSSPVTFDGMGTLGRTVSTPFNHLVIASGTRSVTSSFTVGGDLTVSSGTLDMNGNLSAVGGSVTVNGGTLLPEGPLDVAGGVTVSSGASLVLGAFAHEVAGSVLVSGSLPWTAGATLEFDGTGSTVSVAGSPLPPVLVSAGTRSWGVTTIQGNLTQTGGITDISSGIVTVNGNASFTGGSLRVGNTLDVNGDVTVTATALAPWSSGLFACSGNWVQGAGFVPPGGTVALDGGTAASASGALSFPSLWVEGNKSLMNAAAVTGSVTVFSGTLDANGNLPPLAGSVTVNGGTLLAEGPLDVAGGVTVSSGASLVLGSFAHEVAGSFLISGSLPWTAGATLEFDGSGSTVSVAGSPLPPVLVSAGTRSWGVTTIQGNLTQTGGITDISSGIVTVNGNASFTGGSLRVGNTLDVNGDVTVTATALAPWSSGLFACSGNWVQGAGFVPPGGTVALDGGTAASASGALSFPSLWVEGNKSLMNAAAVTGSVTVFSGTLDANGNLPPLAGSVTVNGGTLLAEGPLDVAGGVTVSSGASLG